ncbi:MAG: hypothetical protein J0G96_07170 [Flavobacteriia bacterium]|nr:hypothetical protein [Flavobacteriia bacterium]OJX36649.1 MAG: hypothetical protein BGO87_12680 [Flavobacteriia bacterium 40-80]
MADLQPLINGKRHVFASVRLNFLGRSVTGFSSISYDDTTDKQDNPGAGGMPNNRGRGNYKATCKIKLYQFEVVGIQKAAGGRRLQSIPMFDIVVTYLPEGADELVVDVVRNCEFLTNGRALSAGDMLSEYEFELITSDIKWHAQTEF